MLCPAGSRSLAQSDGRLIDRLEREEFALADEMVEHEQACDELSQARTALARARTRQDVTDDLAHRAILRHQAIQETESALETDEVFAALSTRLSR